MSVSGGCSFDWCVQSGLLMLLILITLTQYGRLGDHFPPAALCHLRFATSLVRFRRSRGWFWHLLAADLGRGPLLTNFLAFSGHNNRYFTWNSQFYASKHNKNTFTTKIANSVTVGGPFKNVTEPRINNYGNFLEYTKSCACSNI